MKFIGFEREDDAIAWAKQRIGIDGPTGFARALSAVDNDGNFVLVVVMSNFSPRNIDTQVAGLDGGTRFSPKAIVEMFNAIFSYVFVQLGAVRTTGLIRSKNAASRRFVEHLGYELEGIMRESFEDDDLCVYGFLKKDFNEHRWHHGR